MHQFKSFGILSAALLIIYSFVGCKVEDNPYTVDYSLAEELLFDTTGVESRTTETGLIIYELEEGSGSITVVPRDIVLLYYTIRIKASNQVFRSSYANNSTAPVSLNNLASSSQFGDGFFEGVVGMKENGKRVVIIPPSESIYIDTVIVDLNLASIIF